MKWSEAFEDLLAKQVRFQVILWAAMTVSIAIHIGLAFLLTRVVPLRTGGFPGIPTHVFFGLGLLLAVGSVIARRFFHFRAVTGFHDSGATVFATQGMDAEAIDRANRLADAEKRLLVVLQKAGTGNLITWALNEAVGIFGLIGALLRQEFFAVVPFAILAVGLNLLMYPRPRALVAEVASLLERQNPG